MTKNKNKELYLTTRQAAEVLEVHESTIKRWCTEDNLVCEVTSGGHRRLTLKSLLAFSDEKSLNIFFNRFRPNQVEVYEALQPMIQHGNFDHLITYSIKEIFNRDSMRLHNLFYYLIDRSPYSIAQLFDNFFSPLMSRVGTYWEEGLIDVAVEHFTSEIVSDAINYFCATHILTKKSLLTTPQNLVLVACAEGNMHYFGAKCTQIILQDKNIPVYYLGSSLPYRDLAHFQTHTQASDIILSFSSLQSITDVKRAIETLSVFYDKKNPFTLHCGGQGVQDFRLDSLQYPMKIIFHKDLQAFDTFVSSKMSTE